MSTKKRLTKSLFKLQSAVEHAKAGKYYTDEEYINRVNELIENIPQLISSICYRLRLLQESKDFNRDADITSK